MKKHNNWPQIIFWNLLVLLIFILLLEGIAALAYKNYDKVPAIFLRGMRHYYFAYDRNIIQMNQECGEFHKELGYTLRPGNCSFSNLEFETEYAINSLGVRDDEKSLQAPEIIVLGDSYAMGWGVEGDETFAQVLEARTGKSVLNLGISSYGTAREVQLLNKVDLSRLRYLVIQYCENDYYENKAFADNNNVLATMSREKYEEVAKQEALQQKNHYFPGKYAFKLLPAMIRYPLKAVFFEDQEDEIDPEEEIATFLNVIYDSEILNKDIDLVVFEANEQAKNDGIFVANVKQRLGEAPFAARVKVLELADMLNPDDYFLVDSHFKPSAHRKIADGIIKILNL